MQEILLKDKVDVVNHYTSTSRFESRKCGKEAKKWQKFEYLENEKNFLDEIKNIFQFLKGLIWWNKKFRKK